MQLPKQFYYKNNRLQQLRGFIYTVQMGSLSKAAAKMDLTQSAVTLQIQSLERDLKTKLFDRDGKRVVITEAGRRLYEASIPYVYGIDGLFLDFVTSANERGVNLVDIGASHVGVSHILPKYIKIFRGMGKDADFKVRNLSKDDGMLRLVDDEIDLFLYPFDLKEVGPEFEFMKIACYRPVLLLRKDHPLAEKPRVSIANLAKYNLLRLESRYIALSSFDEIVKEHDLKSSIEFEMANLGVLKRYVAADLGVAIVSNLLLENEMDDNLVVRDLNGYFDDLNYGILFKRGKVFNEATQLFMKLVENEVWGSDRST